MTALPARAEAVVAVAWGCASGRGKAVWRRSPWSEWEPRRSYDRARGYCDGCAYGRPDVQAVPMSRDEAVLIHLMEFL